MLLFCIQKMGMDVGQFWKTIPQLCVFLKKTFSSYSSKHFSRFSHAMLRIRTMDVF